MYYEWLARSRFYKCSIISAYTCCAPIQACITTLHVRILKRVTLGTQRSLLLGHTMYERVQVFLRCVDFWQIQRKLDGVGMYAIRCIFCVLVPSRSR